MIKKITCELKAGLATAALLVMFSTTAAAQEKDKVAEGARKVTSEMKSQLTLNESQYTRVLDVNRAYLNKVVANNESGGTAVQKAKKTQALNEERDNKLKSVLNATQYKKYSAGKVANTKKLRETLN